MRLKLATVLSLVATTTVAFASTAWAGPDDPNGNPDDDVENDTPGTPGGSSNQDASSIGCPPGGPPTWQDQGIAAEVEAARQRPVGSNGGLYEDDLLWEAHWGRSRWYRCNTTLGYPIFDYPHPDGLPPIHVEEQLVKPDPQLHPDNEGTGTTVVGFPVWLTLENGGVQEVDLPVVTAEFRAVPQRVAWKTGIGNEEHLCLDIRPGHNVQANLEPPRTPQARPPSDACTYAYERPSTRANTDGAGAYEIVVEITYRIETRPGPGSPWALYTQDPVAVTTSDPEFVRVAELQAVAAGS